MRDNSHIRDYSFTEWLDFAREAGFVNARTHAGRLRLDFVPWISRMKTDRRFSEAIRELQKQAPREVAEHYCFEKDGSFTVEIIFLMATKPV